MRPDGPSGTKAVQPGEVEIPASQDVAGPGLDRKLIKDVHIAHMARRDEAWSNMRTDSESSRLKGSAFPKVFRSGLLFRSIGLILLVILFGCSDPHGSISGTITVPESQSGAIYVLAIPEQSKDKLRVAETEARPHESAWVAGHNQLSSPGSYTIGGLAPGSYVIWGWVDVNGDGGVNHDNYAEPVGWYQTHTNLSLSPVLVEAGKDTAGIDLALIAPTPYPDVERHCQGVGRRKTQDTQRSEDPAIVGDARGAGLFPRLPCRPPDHGFLQSRRRRVLRPVG